MPDTGSRSLNVSVSVGCLSVLKERDATAKFICVPEHLWSSGALRWVLGGLGPSIEHKAKDAPDTSGRLTRFSGLRQGSGTLP